MRISPLWAGPYKNRIDQPGQMEFYLCIYLFFIYKHQIHKTVYIEKLAMYKVTIYTC